MSVLVTKANKADRPPERSTSHEDRRGRRCTAAEHSPGRHGVAVQESLLKEVLQPLLRLGACTKRPELAANALGDGRRCSCLPPRRRGSLRCAASAVLLEVKGLRATVAATGQEILQGVDLTVREGEARTLPPARDCPQALRFA